MAAAPVGRRPLLVVLSQRLAVVAALVAESPVQVLIASRQRPAWVSAKRILYGDVLELNQTALAMDNHEASDVLVGRDGPSASGLVTLANGWPAVIGELHFRLGQHSAAERAWREALRLTSARADREFLCRRLTACRPDGDAPVPE